jgi:pSer/pThr/pTyr-binding forkhead associated (FHA) protein
MAELPKFIIGRGEQADYRVDDEYASPRHAVIRALGRGAFTIEDGGSTNGLWLCRNGVTPWVQVDAPVPLHADDIVTVGRTRITAEGLLYAFAVKVAGADVD